MDEAMKQHWEKVYATKTPEEVSWTQAKPETSLRFIHSFNVQKDAAIIDIGGGDSKLVDFLLEEGYSNITVLDISEQAVIRAQKRLGEHAGKVKWIVSDIVDFVPDTTYDIWHDRAAFHFMNTDEMVARYIQNMKQAVKNGYAVIGTFSEQGPKKCSGIEIRQYNQQRLSTILQPEFSNIACVIEDHTTPFQTQQNFLFCSFKRG
ncbi:SAM-dependent methyltransferase [Taibaiella soli]|uniref:SAM-dependent methyltransferase n=2 Tax=Taibaiella soli TaxID=1649169 RepID=A0A2W2C3M7_9BACT|nr:SAM-dependent methyltransferase [Taibaiella soli]